MDILSSSPTSMLPSTTLSFSDITEVVPFDRVADVLDTVTPDFDEVTDLATTVARRSGRLGVRTVVGTARVVRRHPRGVAGGLAALIALVALGIFLKKRSADNPDLELASAA